MALTHFNRRLLILAGTAFLIVSTYLCATRLFAMDFVRGTTHESPSDEDKPEPIKLTTADKPMSYGDFDRPAFNDVTLTASLPDEYVPTLENHRRLVVVGDIHGMDDALAALLDELVYDPTTDHLVATGDVVSKGPDSPGVLSRLMELNASAVRGNQDDRILLARAEIDSQEGLSAELASPDAEAHRGESQDLTVARSLSPEHIRWLQALPVILTAEPLPVYIVHAGLVAGIPLANQDPWAVMNMRTLVYPKEELRKKEQNWRARRDAAATVATDGDQGQDAHVYDKYLEAYDDTPDIDDIDPDAEYPEEEDLNTEPVDPDRSVAVPVDNRDGEYWYEAWNAHQKRLRRTERRTVVYGHDAKSGLVEGDYTLGLDSGCVTGGNLTAAVIEAAEGGGFKSVLVQVKCTEP